MCIRDRNNPSHACKAACIPQTHWGPQSTGAVLTKCETWNFSVRKSFAFQPNLKLETSQIAFQCLFKKNTNNRPWRANWLISHCGHAPRRSKLINFALLLCSSHCCWPKNNATIWYSIATCKANLRKIATKLIIVVCACTHGDRSRAEVASYS